jgi:hypothetical protein
MMKVDMQDLKSTEVQAMSDDDIKKIIAGGKGKMQPVRSVSGRHWMTLSLTSTA